jgi:hypothetical protein
MRLDTVNRRIAKARAAPHLLPVLSDPLSSDHAPVTNRCALMSPESAQALTITACVEAKGPEGNS